MLNITEHDGALIFMVRVVPRASRSGITGTHDGALHVRLAAPPVDGAANAELIRTLAKALHIAPRNVAIISGQTAKIKRLRVTGADSKLLHALTLTD